MKTYFYVMNADQNIVCKRDNLESAKIAAESCALNYPGASYEILKCVGISSTSKPMTFWMDGESDGVEKPKYRILEEGEIIQDGDEYASVFNGWIPAVCLGKPAWAKAYRRPIETKKRGEFHHRAFEQLCPAPDLKQITIFK